MCAIMSESEYETRASRGSRELDRSIVGEKGVGGGGGEGRGSRGVVADKIMFGRLRERQRGRGKDRQPVKAH